MPEDLERPLWESKGRMLSMLAVVTLLLDLLLTDRSKGDSWVVLEASDSKELPLLEAAGGLGWPRRP